MDLTGYSDRWSVRPGNTIGFHIHSTAAQYEAQVVRLRHGDENPRGPGFKEIVVPSPADGRYPGAPRSIRPGSYGIADLSAAMDGESLWITTWIWPTVPGRGHRACCLDVIRLGRRFGACRSARPARWNGKLEGPRSWRVAIPSMRENGISWRRESTK